MSDRPLLFLAHSSADKPLATSLREAIQLQAGADVEVFLDSETIQPGAIWSERIEDSLLDCSTAVFLLTPNALLAPYMPHEAFLLSLRRRFDTELQLIPVFADGLAPSQLGTSVFKHCRLDALQAVNLPADHNVSQAAAAIAKVHRAEGDWIPWRSVERLATDTLRALSDDGLAQAVEAVEALTPEDGRGAFKVEVVRNKHRWLARRLFRLSATELATFAHRLGPFFRTDPVGLIELLRTLLPFAWVPGEASQVLKGEVERRPPRRALALGFRPVSGSPRATALSPARPFPHVPEFYARRACSRIPPWSVLPGDAVWSHHATEDVRESLRSLALRVLNAELWADTYTDEDLREELRKKVTASGDAIVVVLPPTFNNCDAQLLQQMTEFSEAFTFLLTSEKHQPELSQRFPNLVLLPELPIDKQRELHTACSHALENLP